MLIRKVIYAATTLFTVFLICVISDLFIYLHDWLVFCLEIYKLSIGVVATLFLFQVISLQILPIIINEEILYKGCKNCSFNGAQNLDNRLIFWQPKLAYRHLYSLFLVSHHLLCCMLHTYKKFNSLECHFFGEKFFIKVVDPLQRPNALLFVYVYCNKAGSTSNQKDTDYNDYE